jgi:hypothetical protein
VRGFEAIDGEVSVGLDPNDAHEGNADAIGIGNAAENAVVAVRENDDFTSSASTTVAPTTRCPTATTPAPALTIPPREPCSSPVGLACLATSPLPGTLAPN